jgi:hypothetical protein
MAMKHWWQIFSVVVLILTFESPFLSAQTQPCPASIENQPPQRQQLELLLKRQSEALAHLQQLLPAIRCEYHNHTVSEDCRSFVLNLQDETKEVSIDIAKYRSERNPKPEKLFDIYVSSEVILKQIEDLSEIDEFNGRFYPIPLADAYNSFIKLTGVWFKGEMREVISTLGDQNRGPEN